VTNRAVITVPLTPGYRILVPLILIVGALAPPPAFAERVADWQPIVAEASARFGVPIAWINRVIAAESRGHTTRKGRPITSSAGAMGLMQLMPLTWDTMRVSLRLGANPHDPHDNIFAGTAYLHILYDRFGYPGMFAAYNAGPTRYAAYLATGRALPAETRNYVAGIAGGQEMPTRMAPQTRREGIFVALSTALRPSGAVAEPEPMPGSFVALSPP